MDNLDIIAIFYPPVAVWLVFGFSKVFLINLVLTVCGFYPGVIHALRILHETYTKTHDTHNARNTL
ncbi:MAG: YqaE/Pmp3 family membrane protein [Candidatus Latescibacteria bacterium]|nr:YqaE/Pmp3 family membrane protein [Candidatus Latescibacterota bacterium]